MRQVIRPRYSDGTNVTAGAGAGDSTDVDAFLNKHQQRPYEYGRWDCGIFTRAWAESINPQFPKKVAYSEGLSVQEWLLEWRARRYVHLVDHADDLLLRVGRYYVQVGDIAVYDYDHTVRVPKFAEQLTNKHRAKLIMRYGYFIVVSPSLAASVYGKGVFYRELRDPKFVAFYSTERSKQT